MTAASRVATLFLLAAVACAGAEQDDVLAPRGVTPGRRLPWPEATARDWAFAADVQEIALETRGPRGPRSVTVWCVVVDGALYVATDDGRERKRWVRDLDRDPAARVGILERTYRVRAERVGAGETWVAVVAAYRRKYGSEIAKYDFPRAGDPASGRIYRLVPAG